MKPKVLLFLLVLGCAMIAGLLKLRQRGEFVELNALQNGENAFAKSSRKVARLSKASPAERGSEPGAGAAESSSQDVTSQGESLAASSEPEPEQNARMAAIVQKFSAYGTDLSMYKVEGLKVTNDGLVLADDSETSETESGDTFRRGTLESPPLPFDFPSNGVQPIWRVEAPADTTFYIEMAVSSDQQSWGAWQAITPTGDDILPIRYDGSPNPNYGAESGAPLLDGDRLFAFVRYRLTLASTSEKTPVLQDLKLSYLDSTAGTGRLAAPGEFIEMPVMAGQ